MVEFSVGRMVTSAAGLGLGWFVFSLLFGDSLERSALFGVFAVVTVVTAHLLVFGVRAWMGGSSEDR